MLNHSAAYSAAVTARSRRMLARATFDLYDPDMRVTGVSVSDRSELSLEEQLANRGIDTGPVYATLEPGRWLLNGGFTIGRSPSDHYGWESNVICDANGTFLSRPWAEIAVQGYRELKSVTVVFPAPSENGVARDFMVTIGGTGGNPTTVEIEGNEDAIAHIDGFTVPYPSYVRVTIKKWAVGFRRARVAYLMPGNLMSYSGDDIDTVDLLSEVTFSGLALPHSTCSVRVYNKDHIFDPYNVDGLLDQIKERQPVAVDFGCELTNGSVEWIPAGTFYQQSGGLSTSRLTAQWRLVDIIGLLVNRKFEPPGTLPTTLSGWISAIVSTLGGQFVDHYTVDQAIADTPLTASSDAVSDISCGDLLRFACMAANVFPMQDATTGYLRVSPVPQVDGNRISADNMCAWPDVEANDEISDITFELDSGSVTYTGTNTAAAKSLTVKNPFVHTAQDAQKAFRSCLLEYGGRYLAVKSRGDPTSECGDVQTIDTIFGSTVSARLYKQGLNLSKGVMLNVPSSLYQSTSDGAYNNRVVLTESGAWQVPSGVTKVKLTLIGGGNGGRGGAGGVDKAQSGSHHNEEDRSGGDGGDGGLVFVVALNVTPGDAYSYSCGAGGAGGAGGAVRTDGSYGTTGGATTFGQLTSALGESYQQGVTMIATGDVYAQAGPVYGGAASTGYGSGGMGGQNGSNGSWSTRSSDTHPGAQEYYRTSYPSAGSSGYAGLPGCVIVEW